jgi:hypothetical protein
VVMGLAISGDMALAGNWLWAQYRRRRSSAKTTSRTIPVHKERSDACLRASQL